MSDFFIGAAEATILERLLNSMAQWFIENHNYTIFRLPQVSSIQRSQHILEANYVF